MKELHRSPLTEEMGELMVNVLGDIHSNSGTVESQCRSQSPSPEFFYSDRLFFSNSP